MTTTQDLASIERVEPRNIWPNEAENFTPWLADNLAELGKELGMELELDAKEAPVGKFSVDILAKEIGRDSVVVIENQIERTDHVHLGQLLTYAAGSEANIVIWVTTNFQDEHRAALDWLNKSTIESLEFYGVEIEVVRIGESAPAPLFRLAAFPNSWSKRAKTSNQPVSERGERYRRFWQALLERLGWNVVTDRTTSSYYSAGSGISNVRRTMSFKESNEVSIEIEISNSNKDWNKAFFDALKQSRERIEEDLGAELVWDRLDNLITSRVSFRRGGSIDADRDELGEIQDWFLANAEKFKDVFLPYLREVRDGMPGPE